MSRGVGLNSPGAAYPTQTGMESVQKTSLQNVTSGTVEEVAAEQEKQDSFVVGERRDLVETPVVSTEPVVLRPSELLSQGLDRVRSRFESYEKDEDFSPEVYWNTNAPIDEEWRHGREVSADRTSTRDGVNTTVTHTDRQGWDSTSRENSHGVTLPEESDRGVWKHPVSISLAQWWGGSYVGKGVAARTSKTVKGTAGEASAQAALFAETRRGAGGGGRISPTGVEGGVWARNQVVVAGAQVKAEVKSNHVKIAGQDVNVQLYAKAQPYVGAEAGTYAWADVNVRQPKAVLDLGASAFAGAKAKAHIGFGLKDSELFSARLTGEGWAGVGADAGLHVGLSNGRFSLGASAGAGLGIGGKVGIEIDVDLKAVGKMAHHAIDRDGDGKITAHDAAAGIKQGLSLAATGVEKAADGFIYALDGNGDGKFSPLDLQIRLGQAGDAVVKGSKAVAKGIQRGGEAIAEGVTKTLDRDGNGEIGFSDVGAGLNQAGDALLSAGQSLASAGKKVGAVSAALGRGVVADLKDAGQAVGRGAQKAGEAIHDAMDRDGNGELGLNDIRVAGQQVGETLTNATKATAQAVVNTSKTVASAVSQGAQAVAAGTVTAGEAVVEGAQAVASGVVQGIQAGISATHQAMDRDGDGQLSARDLSVGLQQTGQAIAEGAEALVDGVQAVGKGIADGAEALVDGVQAVGKGIATGAANLATATKEELQEMGSTIKEGAVNAYQRTKATVQRVGQFLGFYE